MTRFFLVNDEMVTRFTYWDDGLCHGMRYADELYRYVSSFTAEKRLDAYTLSDSLREAGETVCLTVDPNKYLVWKALRR